MTRTHDLTRPTVLVTVLALLLAVPLLVGLPADASPEDHYTGPYFGEDNFPPECIRDMSVDNPDNICHHMRTGLNKLDSPKIDVLVMVPVSPTAERDMRIMKQSVEMWKGGVYQLADEMGLNWLRDGAEFNIVIDYIFEDGQGSVDFDTYPAWDPEIVVIATNPVGGVGIGIDPLYFAEALGASDGEGACHGIQNPLDFESWEELPDFDNHHGRSGTYTEDCDGAGGNVCFAINGAIDPEPETIDVFNLFDLVSHEFGHCLTLGHVGDGAEGDWAVVPTNDIMAYHSDPPDLNKCVSTLDVEAFAIRMSRYLDVTGDGAVDEGDRLLANDQIGEGGNPFQVQHPLDHLYASSTGSPLDCPQPDLGLVPGEPTDWTPEPDRATPVLTITSPNDGEEMKQGAVNVHGTAERVFESEDSTSESGMTSSGSTGLRLGTATTETVTFEHEGGNTFTVTDSSLGEHQTTNHFFTLDVAENSDVTFYLSWTDEVAANDLDLYISGARSGTGTSATPDEEVHLADVTGTLDIRVDPWLITDPAGTTYTLTAVITPADSGDDDGGSGGEIPTTEAVIVYVDGEIAGTQDIMTRRGPDEFTVPLNLGKGDHVVRVDWEDRGEVIASDTFNVSVKSGRYKER